MRANALPSPSIGRGPGVRAVSSILSALFPLKDGPENGSIGGVSRVISKEEFIVDNPCVRARKEVRDGHA